MWQAAKLVGSLGLSCPQPEAALGCCTGQTLSRRNLGSLHVLGCLGSVQILQGWALWKICPGAAEWKGLARVIIIIPSLFCTRKSGGFDLGNVCWVLL